MALQEEPEVLKFRIQNSKLEFLELQVLRSVKSIYDLGILIISLFQALQIYKFPLLRCPKMIVLGFDVKMHLQTMGFEDTIKQENHASQQGKAKIMIFLGHSFTWKLKNSTFGSRGPTNIKGTQSSLKHNING